MSVPATYLVCVWRARVVVPFCGHVLLRSYGVRSVRRYEGKSCRIDGIWLMRKCDDVS